MRIEVEKIKNELRIREEKWRKEKEKVKGRIEKKLERMELESKVEGEGKRIREGAEVVKGKRNIEIDEWKERVRKLERRWETKERGDRKRNILIRGLKEGEGEKKTVEELFRKTGGDVEVDEIRRIGRSKREKGDMIIVKMRIEVMKRKILANKWKLKGRETWIEDLTWGERRSKWEIRQAALRERTKGRRIWGEGNMGRNMMKMG
ncbi:apical junction molecule-like [Pogonomyrmex barbatus]|uniref:Apical junction molecule-like n=1 Tax=Pogonomyrmex barbatus TaxID=144034 RepID=A0A8N1S7K7_9HYME|nr:apical junction molecule-like [Pogonomyrmex barbatus]